MSIYSRTVVRGCGLVGGVLLLLLLLSPTMSYRLQSQQQQSLSSKSTQQRNHSQQNHNYNASSRSSSIGSPWPPRIPLWGFLPSSSSSASSPSTSSSSYSSSNHHPNSINHAVAAANSLNAKPSKRESSPSSHNNKGLNNANHLKSNMVDPHHQRPHHFPSTFDTFEDDNDDDDNLLFDDGSSINDDDDAWLVNLKRSSNNLGQQRSGVKRNRIYDVPQIGERFFAVFFAFSAFKGKLLACFLQEFIYC
ncbi:hypothetical protein Fcan01_15038 [Folsomia candida]|uniref:Uncharacterized protein n=1 Tax=Folsomia candida TaxID=158441 RepID=A0A226E1W3_FOLCA|nr:hypothetical protein Fcan01_15038 [Folsomia candida]